MIYRGIQITKDPNATERDDEGTLMPYVVQVTKGLSFNTKTVADAKAVIDTLRGASNAKDS